jgi:hypothetical protein
MKRPALPGVNTFHSCMLLYFKRLSGGIGSVGMATT